MLSGHQIICLASANFYQASQLTVHHLMTRLARTNRVLFVESLGLRAPRLGNSLDRRKVWQRLERWLAGPRRESENFYIYSPVLVPWHNSVLARALNYLLLSRSLRNVAARLEFTNPILWIFLPTAEGLISRLNERLVIYHCVDDYAANPGVPSEAIERLEARLVRRADLVLTTSPHLLSTKRSMNPQTYYFPNLGNIEAFLKEADRPLSEQPELQGLRRPLIGFVGNVSRYKVDIELLVCIAKARPGWTLVLVGPIGYGDPCTDVSMLQACPNVVLLGERSAEEVPRFVHAFNVCLIPYQRNRTSESVFPLKFFEYLALGKPVVSTRLPALVPYERYCYLADSPSEFVPLIEKALNEGSAPVAERIEFARGHSWDGRLAEISTLIERTLAAKRRAPEDGSSERHDRRSGSD